MRKIQAVKFNLTSHGVFDEVKETVNVSKNVRQSLGARNSTGDDTDYVMIVGQWAATITLQITNILLNSIIHNKNV